MNDEAVIHFDGASLGNPGPAGGGAVVMFQGETRRIGRSIGKATNNQAEYEGLILALETAHAMGAKRVVVRGDSQLVIRQMEGKYRVSAPILMEPHRRAKAAAARFLAVRWEWVRREANAEADAEAGRAAQRQA